MTVTDPNAQGLDLLSLGGGEAGEFLVPQGRGISETRTLHGAVDFAVDFFLVAKCKGKIRQKNPPENPPAGIEKSAGGEPPLETPSQTPPPP